MDNVRGGGLAPSAGMGRLSDEVRGLLRSERERTGLSQATLAHRAGVSGSLVSRIESGRVPATLAQAERLLAVLHRQLVVVTEPLGADLDAELDAVAALDLADRLTPLMEPRLYLQLAERFPVVAEGALAALIQGVPVPVAGLDLAVKWDDAEALAGWLKQWGALRWHPRWLEFRTLDLDPRAPFPLRYRMGFVEVRPRMCARLPGAPLPRTSHEPVTIRGGGRGRRGSSRWGLGRRRRGPCWLR